MYPMYHVKNSHPAIIDDSCFEAVKREMAFRAEGGVYGTSQNKYTSKYPFSGMLICGTCGARLRRQIRTVGSGKKVASWGCSRRIVQGRKECDSHHVNESVIQDTYTKAMRQLIDGTDEVIAVVLDGLSLHEDEGAADKQERIEAEIASIQERVLQAQREKSEKKLDTASYNKIIQEASVRIDLLEKQKEDCLNRSNDLYTARAWVKSFKDAIDEGTVMDANNGLIMKQLVDAIIIHDNYMQIRFKCGVTYDQSYLGKAKKPIQGDN